MKRETGIDFRPPAPPRVPAIEDIRRRLAQRIAQQNHADIDRGARQAGMVIEERRPWMPSIDRDTKVQQWIDGEWK